MKRGAGEELKHEKPSKKPKLNLKVGEFALAIDHFKNNPTAKRLKKTNKRKEHSFIKVGDKVVALANKSIEGILGAGTYGLVKVGQDQTGKEYAVKVEGKKSDDNPTETKIMQMLHCYHGTMQRALNAPKRHLSRVTLEKNYTLTELYEGKELRKQIYTLNYTQLLIAAIQCCRAIKELHNKRIIHADIKPENIIAMIDNNNITLNIIDYGFSMILPPNQTQIKDIWKGTKPYMAPECFDPIETFSFESDIFAIGKMFKIDFNFEEELYRNLIQLDPSKRCSLDNAIGALIKELKKQPLDEDVKKVIQGNEKKWFFTSMISNVINYFRKPTY